MCVYICVCTYPCFSCRYVGMLMCICSFVSFIQYTYLTCILLTIYRIFYSHNHLPIRIVPNCCFGRNKADVLKQVALMETANQFPQRGHSNGSTAGESGESGQISQIFDRIMNIIITTSNQHQMVSTCVYIYGYILYITLIAVYYYCILHLNIISILIVKVPVYSTKRNWVP